MNPRFSDKETRDQKNHMTNFGYVIPYCAKFNVCAMIIGITRNLYCIPCSFGGVSQTALCFMNTELDNLLCV